MKKIVIGLVVLIALVSFEIVLGESPVILSPTKDSTVDEELPTTNFGKGIYLRADYPTKVALIEFVVPDATGVSSATLRVRSTSMNNSGIWVYLASPDLWEETTVTWENQPAWGPFLCPIAMHGPFDVGEWIEIDVTKAVLGPGPVTLVLGGFDYRAIALESRESDDPPSLTIVEGAGFAEEEPCDIRSTYLGPVEREALRKPVRPPTKKPVD